MIIRILGHGQITVDDGAMADIEPLDDRLHDAVERGDDAAFAEALAELHQLLDRVGHPLPMDHFGPSDLVLPDLDASMAEVQALLGSHEQEASA